MILRTVIIGILLVVALAVQTAIFPLLPTGWFRPDLLLLVAVAFAFTDGAASGIRIGFVAGLLVDLMSSLAPAGIASLVTIGIAYLVGTVRPYLAATSVSAPLIVAFTTGLVGTATYGMIALLLGDERLTAVVVGQVASAVAMYNVVLAVPVFALVRLISRRFPRLAMAADDVAF